MPRLEVPFFYDFFTNYLSHFYGESFILCDSTLARELLISGATPDLRRDENQLKLGVLVKF
jgi:hypothetical protein